MANFRSGARTMRRWNRVTGTSLTCLLSIHRMKSIPLPQPSIRPQEFPWSAASPTGVVGLDGAEPGSHASGRAFVKAIKLATAWASYTRNPLGRIYLTYIRPVFFRLTEIWELPQQLQKCCCKVTVAWSSCCRLSRPLGSMALSVVCALEGD